MDARNVSQRRGRSVRLLALTAVLTLSLTLVSQRALASDPVRDLLDNAATGGTVGVFLKEVNGPVIISHNESFVFEPASTIKALIHFHAMRQVQEGAVFDGEVVTLATQIPWFMDITGTCPDLTNEGFDTLQNGLTAMMVPSDNRWTQALRDFFGDTNIDATRQTFGMDDTVLAHLIGCLVSMPPAGFTRGIDDPNQLTLVDAGKMYEAIATGFLDDATRDQAFALMTQDNTPFNNVIDAEAVGLGLSAASINSFKAQRQSAQKAGSYTGAGMEWRSVAGWAQIPWKDALNCGTEIRQYVYGAFIDGADSIDASFIGIRPAGVELFRDEISAALQSWADCEADLQITSSIVVDPPAQIDVNTDTVLTLRVAVRNNGPASPVDARLVIEPTVPADCAVTPAGIDETVPALAQGVVVPVERNFTVQCADPSTHSFRFDSDVSPAIALMVDPVPGNNTGVAVADIPVIALADLAIVGWDFSELEGAGLGDLLVGQDFLFSTTKTLANNGDSVGDLYHQPVDAIVTKSLEVPEGVRGIVVIGGDEAPATVTIQRPGEADEVLLNQAAGTVVAADGPATLVVEFAVAALAVGVDREIAEGFGIHCLAPGEHEVSFLNAVAAQDEHVLDPVPANNTAEAVRSLECVTPVQINIRPGNALNLININSRQALPVAILTTDAGEYGLPLAFDATAVDRTTVRFGTLATLNGGGGSLVSPDRDFIRDSFEMDDSTKDGDLDMVVIVLVPGSGITTGTSEACLVGSYTGEDSNLYSFLGCDFVATQP